MPPLKNGRREKFCLGVLEGLTDVKSYVRAGYGKGKTKKQKAKSARKNASHLRKVPEVAARILELQEIAAQASVLTRQEAERILSELARGCLTDYQGAKGGIRLTADSPNPRAVQEITERTETTGEGKAKTDALIRRIKLHCPKEAIALLAKMNGWIAAKAIDLRLKKPLEEMTDDELRDFANQNDSES